MAYPTVCPAPTVAFTLIKLPSVPVLPSNNCILFRITLLLLLLLKLQFSLLPELIRSLVCIIAPPVLATVIYFVISMSGVFTTKVPVTVTLNAGIVEGISLQPENV